MFPGAIAVPLVLLLVYFPLCSVAAAPQNRRNVFPRSWVPSNSWHCRTIVRPQWRFNDMDGNGDWSVGDCLTLVGEWANRIDLTRFKGDESSVSIVPGHTNRRPFPHTIGGFRVSKECGGLRVVHLSSSYGYGRQPNTQNEWKLVPPRFSCPGEQNRRPVTSFAAQVVDYSANTANPPCERDHRYPSAAWCLPSLAQRQQLHNSIRSNTGTSMLANGVATVVNLQQRFENAYSRVSNGPALISPSPIGSASRPIIIFNDDGRVR